MKKVVRLFGMACLMGVFAFCSSSCKKNEETVSSISIDMPTVEESFIDGEKAYIDYSDGNKMKWSAGDEVMVYNLKNDYTQSERVVYTLSSGANTTIAHFQSPGAVSATTEQGFFVFYPASKVVNHALGERNSQTFDVPATQTYALNQMDPTSLVMACKVDNPHNSFNMKHIFGFANFRMKGTKKVASVKVIDDAFNLNGTITADIPGVDEAQLSALIEECGNASDAQAFDTYMSNLIDYLQTVNYTSEPVDKTMTLECPQVGVQLNANTYTNFIVTLRPGALAKGFSLLVTFTDESEVEITKYQAGITSYTTNVFCIKPGRLLNFNIEASDMHPVE